jgi:hypothetical protein
MTFLKALYTFSIALFVLAFVVFGIAALPTPEPSGVPPELASIEDTPTEEQQALLAEQGQEQQAFQEQISVYNQVVSFLTIGVAVALLAASILWLQSVPVIGEGVTLGAVFTLLYGLYSAYSTSAGLLTFVAVALGLLVLLALVYWQLIASTGVSGESAAPDRQPTPEQTESTSVGATGNKGTAS